MFSRCLFLCFSLRGNLELLDFLQESLITDGRSYQARVIYWNNLWKECKVSCYPDWRQAVWPDGEIKRNPYFPIVAQKVKPSKFSLKETYSKIAQKVAKYLCYLCKQSYFKELSRIGQSGHTEGRSLDETSVTRVCVICQHSYRSMMPPPSALVLHVSKG